MADEGDSFFIVLLSGVDISRGLQQRCRSYPRDIETLTELVRDFLSVGNPPGTEPFQILFHPRIYQAQFHQGKNETYNTNRAEIFYNLDTSFCWRRFIIAKELCHLLYVPLGTRHTASTPEQVEQLISNLIAGLDKVDLFNDHVTSTETATVLMALEVLLPHTEREQVEAMLQHGATHLDVATRYRVPQSMISLYVSAGYKMLMNKTYTAADKVLRKIPSS